MTMPRDDYEKFMRNEDPTMATVNDHMRRNQLGAAFVGIGLMAGVIIMYNNNNPNDERPASDTTDTSDKCFNAGADMQILGPPVDNGYVQSVCFRKDGSKYVKP